MNPTKAVGFSSRVDAEVESSFAELDRLLHDWQSGILILSHEVLGNLPLSIKRIAGRALNLFSAEEVIVIGYTRIQSSYYQAAYKQWFFRSPNHLKSDIEFLVAQGFLPDHFSPVERRIMVESIKSMTLEKPVRNWFAFYKSLNQFECHKGSYLVKSNHIPTTQMKYSLLADFLSKAGIRCDSSIVQGFERRTNPAYSWLLCEAIASSICDDSIDSSWAPSPHDVEGNAWLRDMSAKVNEKSFALTPLACSSDLLKRASRTIDTNSFDSNAKYCELMDVDLNFFRPEAGTEGTAATDPILRLPLYDAFKYVEYMRSPEDIRRYQQGLNDIVAMIGRLDQRRNSTISENAPSQS